MRIAITADPEIPVPPLFYGGIERIIDLLIKELLKRGHEITLFAHKDSKVNCRLVPYKSSSILKNMFTINAELLSGRYDVIHSFGRLLYMLPVLPFKTGKLMSYQREPTISQIKKAVRIARKNTLYFTGCSRHISNQIKPFAQAKTIYNAVEIDRYQFVSVSIEDAPLIFLGRIEPIKGAHLAVQTALKSGNKLILAGNIPDEHKPYFNKEIRPFLNENIVYAGPVDDHQKNILLGKAKALLMPIQWNEPFGIVMIEAMACGTPVIGFKRGAVPEVLEHGKTGFLVDCLDEMIEQTRHIGLLNRPDARKSVEEKFSADVITRQYEKLYEQIS